MSQRNDLVVVLIGIFIAMGVGVAVMWMLKGSGLHHHFIANLPSYKIDGILILLAASLAVNYRSAAGRVCFFYMLVGAAIMIGCHLVLHGLPAYDRGDDTIKSAYALFGGLFYVGIVVSLTTACVGLYRRDKKEMEVSQAHT